MKHRLWWGLAALAAGTLIGGRIGVHRQHQRAELWKVATEGVSSVDPHPRWF
ncbi:MAG: hypothetical protein LKI24_03045 [Acidipropionibacterium sp.]|jgi:uncharacterized membrane protein YfcA|nr:hypothetical protein [Acidipropionibacterium sp.]